MIHLHKVLKEVKLTYEDRNEMGVFFCKAVMVREREESIWVVNIYVLVWAVILKFIHSAKVTELYTLLNTCVLCVCHILIKTFIKIQVVWGQNYTCDIIMC